MTSKKRSEITVVLTRESANLELEEGRQLVKTIVKNPPFSFNADYSQQNSTGWYVNRKICAVIFS